VRPPRARIGVASEAWREKSFDTEGDLCKAKSRLVELYSPGSIEQFATMAIKSREQDARMTYEDIRPKETSSKPAVAQLWTPMFIACNQGHFHVATWLFVVGTAGGVLTAGTD